METTKASDVFVKATATKKRSRLSRFRKKQAVWMEDTPIWMSVGKGVLLLFIAIVMVFPFMNVIATSLTSQENLTSGGFTLWPSEPTLDSYRALLNGGIVLRSLQVTALLTIVGTFIQVAFTTMMAYGLSKPGVPGSKFFFMLVLIAFMFAPGLIPRYLLVKEVGLLDTFASLVIPGLIGAWNLIIARNFFQNLPQDLLDAARIDGASDIGVFRHVALPLSKAVIAVISLFSGVALWNTFFAAVLYITDSTKWPIQVVLRQYVISSSPITSAADLPPGADAPPTIALQMAMVVLATLPILLVYPFLQKYFAKGVITGAIKG